MYSFTKFDPPTWERTVPFIIHWWESRITVTKKKKTHTVDRYDDVLGSVNLIDDHLRRHHDQFKWTLVRQCQWVGYGIEVKVFHKFLPFFPSYVRVNGQWVNSSRHRNRRRDNVRVLSLTSLTSTISDSWTSRSSRTARPGTDPIGFVTWIVLNQTISRVPSRTSVSSVRWVRTCVRVVKNADSKYNGYEFTTHNPRSWSGDQVSHLLRSRTGYRRRCKRRIQSSIHGLHRTHRRPGRSV